MNQSIKSDAGSSYESRVYNTLLPIVEDLKGHSHDKNIHSVEYDNTFIFNNKKCGVSAKRTLRERYKQNFEDVSLLEVDYMFVITLGIDLNEEKLYVYGAMELYLDFINIFLRILSIFGNVRRD